MRIRGRFFVCLVMSIYILFRGGLLFVILLFNGLVMLMVYLFIFVVRMCWCCVLCVLSVVLNICWVCFWSVGCY